MSFQLSLERKAEMHMHLHMRKSQQNIAKSRD